jgi:U4/U6.U5 tri-snRNP-associated protein 1
MSSRRPTARKGDVSNSEHESSLSIEETNKLRASLGLDPLKVSEPSVAQEKKECITNDTNEGGSGEELRARVEKARKAREEKQATLGEVGDDINDEDMLAWIQRNRNETIREKPSKRQRVESKDMEEGDEELLKNAKVKGHSLEALDTDGEMILTLADKGILDDSGKDIMDEDEIVLENVRERENMEREHALKASRKAKPLWEEDGMKRSMLDKYDEEEEEAFILGDLQANPSVTKAGQEDMKDKLLAAQSSLLAPLKAIGGDYLTSEELEAKGALKKKKKKKKKKERSLKKKALTADDLDELEMAARETGQDHLASKHEREERRQEMIENELVEMSEKRSKFDTALEKANIASRTLRDDNPGIDNGDDEEDELAASLAKARSIALQNRKKDGLESLAKEAIQRRERQDQAMRAQHGSLTFTDIGEFARSVGGQDLDSIPIKEEKPLVDDAIKDEMQVDVKEEEDMERKPARKYHVHQEDNEPTVASTDEVAPITHETKIGQGLGGVLSYLKERGELHKPVEWAGRTNDSRNAFFTGAMGGYQDVYTSGRSEDEIAANVEVALTRKDEFGRVLTPKEAFRQFCHNFHGIQPSQGSKEKRMKQAAKELAQKKAATGSIESGVVNNFKALQQKKSTPYMVLSGTVKPGQTRDATRDT